jgi:hypothetical protein
MVTIAAVDSMGREGDSTTPITVTTNLAAQGTVQSYKLTITGGGGVFTYIRIYIYFMCGWIIMSDYCIPFQYNSYMFSGLTHYEEDHRVRLKC